MGRRTATGLRNGHCCCTVFMGVRASNGVVLDASTIQVNFSACVNITGTTGIEYSIDGGAWVAVAGVVKVDDNTYNFDITPATIAPGDDVQWRYVGGSGTIVDCADAEDIGDQLIPIHNPLVLAGNFILLETGGTNVILLEDALVDPDDGITTEDAA